MRRVSYCSFFGTFEEYRSIRWTAWWMVWLSDWSVSAMNDRLSILFSRFYRRLKIWSGIDDIKLSRWASIRI